MDTNDEKIIDENIENVVSDAKPKLNIKDIVKKWWFWVIIAVVIIGIIIAIIVGVSNRHSVSVIGGADGPAYVENVTEKDKHNKKGEQEEVTGEDLILPEYKDYVAGLENQPQTDEQRKALNYAMDYATYSNMSYNEMVDMLEHDGIAHDDAVYGVDNCGADWNALVVKKAQAYVDEEPKSRIALVTVLMASGFSEAEANYGADNAGINYTEQAVKMINIYLSVENYDKDTLIEMLQQGDGFTKKEATDAVRQAGL